MNVGILNPLATGEAVKTLLDEIRRQGLEVETGNNFYKFEKLRAAERPESKISVFFDPESSSDLDSRAQWFRCVDEEGRTVATVANRIDFIDTNLSEHAANWMTGLHANRTEEVRPRRRKALPYSLANKIKGSVAYQGETWVAKRYRDRGLGALISQLGVLMFYMRWSPDWAFGLLSPVLEKRLTWPTGFAVRERAFLDWIVGPDGGDEQKEVCIFVDREGMAHLAETIREEGIS